MKRFLRVMAANMYIVAELLSFFWQRKLWWLLPMLLVLVVFGTMMMFASTSGLGPFLYSLF